MWEHVSSVIVTTNALQRTPYAGQSCEESEKPGVGRSARRSILPAVDIQAKEEFKVLFLPC
jgi:hypothetical protein